MINIVVEKQENKVYRKKLSVSRENKRSESPLLREDDLCRDKLRCYYKAYTCSTPCLISTYCTVYPSISSSVFSFIC